MGRIVRQGNENKEVDIYRYVTNATFDAYLWQTLENKQRFISQIMTSKSPVRSCEDTDEATLSYAEVKALCAGDPKIKEKMDLEIEVAKLKVMQANHKNQQYDVQSRVHKELPERIAAAREVIEKLSSDVEFADAHKLPEDKFDIEVLGAHYEKREDAGKALIAICKGNKSTAPIDIGEYRGFKISVKFDTRELSNILQLKNNLTYAVIPSKDAIGNIRKLDNAVGAISTRRDNTAAQLENLEMQLETAKAELDKPFPQADELKEKTERLAILEKELSMDDSSESREVNAAEAEEPLRDGVMPLPKRTLHMARGQEDKPTEVKGHERVSVREKLMQNKRRVSAAAKPSKERGNEL